MGEGNGSGQKIYWVLVRPSDDQATMLMALAFGGPPSDEVVRAINALVTDRSDLFSSAVTTLDDITVTVAPSRDRAPEEVLGEVLVRISAALARAGWECGEFRLPRY